MKCIFGPVASRRLGRSLGVDLVPYKTCSFDCVYCELGRTTQRTVQRKEYIPLGEILVGLKRYLPDLSPPPDYITLGGSGEPTLHAKTGSLIAAIKQLTSIPVAVLTNSSLLYQAKVKDALLQADVILPSLDTVHVSTFARLNRPHPSLMLPKIIQGLIDLRKDFKGQMWLEVLLCQGINDSSGEINDLKKAIKEIKPDKIQLNTLDRPPAEEGIFSVTVEQLQQIQKVFGKRAEIVSHGFVKKSTRALSQEKSKVYALVKRRPCTLEEIALTLGLSLKKAMELVADLRNEGKVSLRIHNNRSYFQGR